MIFFHSLQIVSLVAQWMSYWKVLFAMEVLSVLINPFLRMIIFGLFYDPIDLVSALFV